MADKSYRRTSRSPIPMKRVKNNGTNGTTLYISPKHK